MLYETNFIIKNGNELPGDAELFFSKEPVVFLENVTMIDLLVYISIFPSKGQARKNWEPIQKKLELDPMEIPEGWSDFYGLGKLNHRITILNPKEDTC